MLERLAIPPAKRGALTDRLSGRAWSTPHAAIVLGALLLLYFLVSFAGIFFREEQIPLVRLLATLLMYATIMTIIAFIVRRRGGSWTNGFGMGPRQLKTLALAPLLYLATLPLMALVLLVQQLIGIEPELQDVAKVVAQEVSGLQLLYISTAIFVAPLFEEIVFRGMLLPYLVKRTGLAGGTALASILFAAMHFHLPAFAPLFLLSAVLCLAYWRIGSLWVCIGMHTIFNTVSIFALNFSKGF